MKFDTVIIGGGLAGLTCGIRLQKKGKRCMIVSEGQSALHFSSGSFDLLGMLPDGTDVKNPLEAVASLPATHPYSKIGVRFSDLVGEARLQLLDAGVDVTGDAAANSYRITPMGTSLPTWLTLPDFATLPAPDAKLAGKVLIINFEGFLDFNTAFVAAGLEASGAECTIKAVTLPELDHLRISPTEMRSANIAKVFDNEETLSSLINIINGLAGGYDAVVLPAVFGMVDGKAVRTLNSGVKTKVCLLPTMPPSVAGIRTQQQLRHCFERLGGTYLLGDTVNGVDMEAGKVKAIRTENLGNMPVRADNFVLASGSFFSNGLVAQPHCIIEPVFGADIDCDADRNMWFNIQLFEQQPYLSYGVATDASFRLKKDGAAIENVYAIGSVLSGFDPIQEGCGGGVAMLTALFVADELVKE